MTKKPYSKPQIRGFEMPFATAGGVRPMGACGGGSGADVCGAGSGALQWGCGPGKGDAYGCNVGKSASPTNNCFAGNSANNPS